MGNAEQRSRDAWERELADFAGRFWQVMSAEVDALTPSTHPRYWEMVRGLSLLRAALDLQEGESGRERTLLLRMRLVLDAFGGRQINSEPYRRAQSVEERAWYVQWSGLGSETEGLGLNVGGEDSSG